MEKRDYINQLKNFCKEKGITIYEYYYAYATTLKSGKHFVLPDFEQRNPFLKTIDIKLLLESNDPQIAEYYAYVMTQVIDQQVISKEEIKETVEESFKEPLTREDIKSSINDEFKEPITRDEIKEVLDDVLDNTPSFKVRITSISKKLADTLNGFAIIREEKTGRAHMYYYDAKSSSLTGEQVFKNNELKADSGYYVNYQEYVEKMMDEILENCPEVERIKFIREDGETRSFEQLVEEVFAIIRKNGGSIRYGQSLIGKEINTYKDLINNNDNQEEEYKGNGKKVRSGIYVRRDILNRIISKFKAKVTYFEDNNDNSIKK